MQHVLLFLAQFKFTELHALTLAARSYVLLTGLIAANEAGYDAFSPMPC